MLEKTRVLKSRAHLSITFTMSVNRTTILLFLLSFLFAKTPTAIATTHHPRRLLHQPFFPLNTAVSPATQPPSQSPQPESQAQQPKYPLSTTSTTPQSAFFPFLLSPPPPLLPPSASLTSFPANVSFLLFPHSPSSSISHHHLLVIVLISLSLLFAAILATLTAFLLYSRRHQHHPTPTTFEKASGSDSLRLFPPNTVPSDGSPKLPGVPNTSSEFLYLGTLVNSRASPNDHPKIAFSSNDRVKIGVSSSPYRRLGSPELKPLPPLPKHNYTPSYRSGEVLVSSHNEGEDGWEIEEGEEFFSPRGSFGRKESLNESTVPFGSSSRREFEVLNSETFGSRSFNSRTASYPYSNLCSPDNSVSSSSSSVSNSSPNSIKFESSDTVVSIPAPVKSSSLFSSSTSLSKNTSNSQQQCSGSTTQKQRAAVALEGLQKQSMTPPPPPPLPARFWEVPMGRPAGQEADWVSSGSPFLITPSRPAVVQKAVTSSTSEQVPSKPTAERSEETTQKPKLKPLHWDKVRASSDRAMVWDQIKFSSFQLNEEMIETLFIVNNSNLNIKENNGRRQSFPLLSNENLVLDPKKSQNISILLRALNVTTDEVCEALLEGSSDTLGTELLESLLKMAPSKEEEQKLKDFKDESPVKLGSAEKFLKAVFDIPFAFKRVDAMLYIANFDFEVEYLRRSFETLKVACEELRNSKMFLKILEAVLKTGNRMNDGTNRGNARAFKLDTLLKLVGVKGTDGKTTLLHFVVQEIIRSEGSRLFNTNHEKQFTFGDDIEFRKLGLKVVSSLSGELINVKKAAAMDSEVLSNEVAKLANGITKIGEVIRLTEEIPMKECNQKFADSMNGFLKMAAEEIERLQVQGRAAISQVKEITEYFHGNSDKEEAHPFRIFMVVRDFLSTLDHVCKDVGKINERTIYSSVRPMPMNSAVQPVFPSFNRSPLYDSPDDEGSSFSS
ncbi:hypothetical protein K2173_017169 [Erythroxylum novogranatense]|uniref:Formin-like protein n=1 Tax=Erythroxylum novogranatense TaxID=1862640 RepID=A0AAV8UA79_9ROSI|nr:hypothetical protein K2173_017169 [Erythroxylum novogranatense]